ncbi:hypothetical protein GCM10022294_22680 [Dietzia aurantiaca]
MFPDGFVEGVTDFTPRPPEADMLYLSKAFNSLREMTRPTREDEPARPAFRMFEGLVDHNSSEGDWEPWLRTIPPPRYPRSRKTWSGSAPLTSCRIRPAMVLAGPRQRSKSVGP